ncbi:hypothetical protein SCLCIDRAFT_132663, partial [Scleroderma citrinum Foug A]
NVSTCWNLSFNMVDFVLDYCVPVESITDKQQLGLGNYALNEHEWTVLAQLHDILKDGTLFFSHGTPSSLAMVLPAMDYINEAFTTGMLNQQHFDPAI